jgi:hypothetical protein
MKVEEKPASPSKEGRGKASNKVKAEKTGLQAITKFLQRP